MIRRPGTWLTFALGLASGSVLACGGDAPPPNVTFDGQRAYDYAALQVTAGPRVPGTEPHRLVGDRIVEVLRANADTVFEQKWTHKTAKGDTLPLRNIFAQFNPKATTRILMMSHWDSRPHADASFSTDDKLKPVPGADDGASSTGLLLTIAEALKKQPTTIGVDLLFTDAEDYGDFSPKYVDVLLGAQYFADHPLPDASYKPTFGILFDMIGDKDLLIKKETNSQEKAADINDLVWKMANALGYRAYFTPEFTPGGIGDDHMPLLAKGWKVIDMIDLDYDHHHKVTDTMDKISAQSLEIVGRVAMAIIRAQEAKK